MDKNVYLPEDEEDYGGLELFDPEDLEVPITELKVMIENLIKKYGEKIKLFFNGDRFILERIK